ncbi:MAG: flagellar motor switch phosphatase FliY [Lachnospiraceae bacterium]|nr:flagellar motor switch phosphatase FliY [Lachnospiraceae bacterium]
MDGILSQDEINALLSGMDLSENQNTQEEAPVESFSAEPSGELSDIEKDAIGEIANISMGTSATTLYSLVNRKVEITTPTVVLTKWDELIKECDKPCVVIQIKYTSGLDGTNILMLKEQDVKIITDLMMGGDGTNVEGDLSDIHLSAISEAMNQMMGSSATSLSSMLGKKIDISPPQASLVDIEELNKAVSIADFLKDTFVQISFRMKIGDLVDSTILQLYPIEFAREVCESFKIQQLEEMGFPLPKPSGPIKEPESYVTTPAMGTAPSNDPAPATAPASEPVMPDAMMNMNQSMGMTSMGMNPNQNMGMPNMGMNQMNMGMPMYQQPQMPNVNVQPALFQPFMNQGTQNTGNENIGLIMDVPLEVTVELGRTTKSISDILSFAPGTIIELNKIAGEPIDVLVNGKFVAKGEVVVIEESFGIRVTEIIK